MTLTAALDKSLRCLFINSSIQGFTLGAEKERAEAAVLVIQSTQPSMASQAAVAKEAAVEAEVTRCCES